MTKRRPILAAAFALTVLAGGVAASGAAQAGRVAPSKPTGAPSIPPPVTSRTKNAALPTTTTIKPRTKNAALPTTAVPRPVTTPVPSLPRTATTKVPTSNTIRN